MKSVLICTIKNEESSIKNLLNSIAKQTHKPDEVIIADGGSSDTTVNIVNSYKNKIKGLKIIVSKGANISKGRNIAIENSSSDIILSTDGGCILDKNWVKNLVRYYPEYDVVSGVYEPNSKNDFEFFQGKIVAAPKESQNTVSRMSSRSLSFKRSVWDKVGGYPENTYTGEDTSFNLKIRKAGFKIFNEKDALVKWNMRPTWKSFAKQFYIYGKGDKKTRNIVKMKPNLIMVIGFWVYVTMFIVSLLTKSAIYLILFSFFVMYFIYNGVKIATETKRINGIYYGTLLVLVKRISYILGVTFGPLEKSS